MTNRFQLLGADRFSLHLDKILDGILTAEGPEIVDRSYNGQYAKRWKVRLDGEQIGEYYTFGPKPGETDFCREYRGRIPGYRNECIAVANEFCQESKRMLEDQVFVVYDNGRCGHIDETLIPHLPPHGELTAESLKTLREEHQFHSGRYVPVLVKTPWQRQDGHDQIPFP